MYGKGIIIILLSIKDMLKKTNWIIITGEPRCGKTKLVEYLAFCGLRTCPEVSRILIDDAMSRGEESNIVTIEYEKKLFREKLQAEERFNPLETVIWDRSPVDSVAFSELYHKRLEEEFISQLKFQYKHVFYLCSLPRFLPDYATAETEQSSRCLGNSIKKYYRRLGYVITEVPVMDIRGRAKFVMERAQIASNCQYWGSD